MIDVGPEDAAKVVAGAGGAIAALLGIRRMFSRETSAQRSDRAGDQLLASYQSLLAETRKERNEAMETARVAWSSRTEDAKTIARLEAQNVTLAGNRDHLLAEVARLKRELEETVNEFNAFKRLMAREYPELRERFGSGFMPL